MFGYSREEMIGQKIETLVPERFRAKHPGHREAFFGDPKTRSMGAGRDLFGLKKDGAEVPIEIGLNPIKTTEGAFVLASIIDITERKRGQEGLAQLAAIVESSDDAIIGKTLEGLITSWNKGAQKLYGYTAEEVLGKSLSLLSPSGHSEELSHLLEQLSRGEHISQYEIEKIRKDGQRVLVAITASPILDSLGRVVGASVTARDISERKRAETLTTEKMRLEIEIAEHKKVEKKIQETTKIKDDFTAMVSHELRTPLAVIKEGLDIVVDGTSGPLNADQQKYLETANRNVDRLGRLINDVLDYQKFESGHVDFNMASQDMNGLVGEIVQGFLPVAEKKGLELTSVYQKDLPPVMYDKDKITQVLTNLINNAVKFTSQGGVKITTDSGDNWIRISVHDTGEGIKGEDRTKLFQSFSQLSTGGARKTGGTGLGLVISKEIVTKHHGRIEVDSVHGKGSTFHVILPIADRRKHSG
ncbi:MAG TPA: PAS domain S-box protein [bacterium]|nr:PAS domain S-box protein [bacterium]